MSFIPARKSAGLCKVSSTVNSLKEHVYTWSAPVDYPVCGWWASSDEPFVAGHERVEIRTNLITPVEFPAEPRDRVVLDGILYEIDGYAQDHTNGPWWNPGVVVWNLTRIEGG